MSLQRPRQNPHTAPGPTFSGQRATPGSLAELPYLHNQQASTTHCLPKAAELSARTFKGSCPPPQHTALDWLPTHCPTDEGRHP